MKTRIIIVIAAAMALVSAAKAQNVHYGESFELNSTLNANQSHEYYANSYIDLKTGFHSEPTSHNQTVLQLDSEGYNIYPPTVGQTNNNNCVVGSFGGTVNVGAMGGLIYTIPLELPLGINGMKPNLSITYNNQAGNGIMGWGWSLTGLSSITRTGQTLYHDGKLSAADLSWNDRFLMDGKRLVEVADYTDSVEYRLEQDEMSKIMAYFRYERSGGAFGYGTVKVLDHFVMWKTDGLIMKYGTTQSSWIEPQNGGYHALCWLLSEVSDRNGNSITYHYHEDQSLGVYLVDTIEYTSNVAQEILAQFIITFEYSYGRQDYEQYFINSNQIRLMHLLDCINVSQKSDSKIIYKYKFEYKPYTQRHYEMLESVGMMAYDPSGQLEKTETTSIAWSSSSPYTLLEKAISNPEIFDDCFPFLGDFNGDGYTDVALAPYKDTTVYPNPVNVSVYLNNRNGGFEHVPSMDLSGLPASLDWIHVLDINGDGLDDLVPYFYDTVPASGTETTKVRVYLNSLASNSFSFLGERTINSKGEAIVGDFDGDGVSDVILLEKKNKEFPLSKDGKTTIQMPVIKNVFYLGYRFGQFQNAQINTDSLEDLCPVYNTIVGDFNGDGIHEVLFLGTDETGSQYLGSKTARFDFNDSSDCLKVVQTISSLDRTCQIFPGDFNGDGKTDILYFGFGRWQMRFSKGDLFGSSYEVIGSGLPEISQYHTLLYPSLNLLQNPMNNQYLVSISVNDFDGDGCSDVVFTGQTNSKLFIGLRIEKEPSIYGYFSFRVKKHTDNIFLFRSQFIHVGNFLGRDNVSFLGKKQNGALKIYYCCPLKL